MSQSAARYQHHEHHKPCCPKCGQEFIPTSRHHRLCPDCRSERERRVLDVFEMISQPAGERLVAGYRMLEAR